MNTLKNSIYNEDLQATNYEAMKLILVMKHILVPRPASLCVQYLASTNENEVKQILTIGKSNTAEYNDIPPQIIRNSSLLIAKPLTSLINLTLQTGTVQDKLRIAKVI